MNAKALFILCLGASALLHQGLSRLPVAPRIHPRPIPPASVVLHIVKAPEPAPPVPVEPKKMAEPIPPPPEPEPAPEQPPEPVEEVPAPEEPEPEPEPAPEVLEDAQPDEEVVMITAEAVADAKDSYWAMVSRTIAANLRYPASARRTGIRGTVTLHLEIASDGTLREASPVSDICSRILVREAERAARAASPFPPPPAEWSAPVTANLPIRFTLER